VALPYTGGHIGVGGARVIQPGINSVLALSTSSPLKILLVIALSRQANSVVRNEERIGRAEFASYDGSKVRYTKEWVEHAREPGLATTPECSSSSGKCIHSVGAALLQILKE
jgi:hypothetical protein